MNTKQKRLAVLSICLLVAVAVLLFSLNWSDWVTRTVFERRNSDRKTARTLAWESDGDYEPLSPEEAMAIYYGHLKRLGVRSEFSAAEIESCGKPHVRERTKEWPFRLAEIDGPIGISIDEQSHKIRSYINHPLRDEKDKTLDPKKPARLSKGEAARLAWQLWDRVRESNDRKNLRLAPMYYAQEGGYWFAVVKQTYGGYDTCFSGHMKFFEDGQLYSFREMLPPIECPLDIRVTVKDARRKARKAVDVLRKTHRFFKKSKLNGEVFLDEETGEYRKTGEVRPVVVPVINWREETTCPDLYDRDGPLTFRLAYWFTYEVSIMLGADEECKHKAMIFIDTITGDCVAVHY